MVTYDTSRMLMLFCIDSVNQFGWSFYIDWLHKITVNQLQFSYAYRMMLVIRLEDKLRPIIGFTLWGNLAMLPRSAITPAKVNRFG